MNFSSTVHWIGDCFSFLQDMDHDIVSSFNIIFPTWISHFVVWSVFFEENVYLWWLKLNQLCNPWQSGAILLWFVGLQTIDVVLRCVMAEFLNRIKLVALLRFFRYLPKCSFSEVLLRCYLFFLGVVRSCYCNKESGIDVDELLFSSSLLQKGFYNLMHSLEL